MSLKEKKLSSFPGRGLVAGFERREGLPVAHIWENDNIGDPKINLTSGEIEQLYKGLKEFEGGQ